MRSAALLGLAALACLLCPAARAADEPLKFGDVKEVAPGVWFRYSAISPTDDKIFGGSNNIWVEFEDFVVVIDANFPKGAGEVIEAIKKTTTKPIRYVFDTHHHGDHAYGNAVFAKEGAGVIAQANCAAWLRLKGADEFKKAGEGPTGRKDVAESTLKVPNVVFDDKLVLEDSKQRVEFLFLGHAHTPGDAVAYLPRHKILCTGDACVNGAFNYAGHSDTASWIRALEKMQQLDVKLVCPGHGLPTGPELFAKEKRWFTELREQVRKGVEAGKDLDEIREGIDMPWYKEWTTVAAKERKENVEHVFNEMTGRAVAWDLMEDFGLLEGPSPTKDSAGWTKPKRIVIPNLMPARLKELKRVVPDVEFVPVRTAEEAAKAAEDADAVVGFATAEVAKAGKSLRWLQAGAEGYDKGLAGGKVVLTDLQGADGPPTADEAFGLLLALTRGLKEQGSGVAFKPQELHGKTLLVVGLGPVGKQVSRRAHAFGMRVLAIDQKEKDRPDYVFSLEAPAKLPERLGEADVVVLACPLTDETRGLVGEAQLKAMKKGAVLVNVGAAPLVKADAVVEALKDGRLAGAGLDAAGTAALASDHPLRKLPNVVLGPGGSDPEAAERQWRLWRENVRRFVAGEPLLCVVEK
jgi:phosphoglycerate dehydrogenase-like enzyme/glyoxylase-like metal-dependent hydrolase (beta-lactamase superfamily II)